MIYLNRDIRKESARYLVSFSHNFFFDLCPCIGLYNFEKLAKKKKRIVITSGKLPYDV